MNRKTLARLAKEANEIVKDAALNITGVHPVAYGRILDELITQEETGKLLLRTQCGHSLADCHTDKCFRREAEERFTLAELKWAYRELSPAAGEHFFNRLVIQARKNRAVEKKAYTEDD